MTTVVLLCSLQASDDYVVQHKADNNDIVLFLFKTTAAGTAGARMKVRSVAVISHYVNGLLY